MPAQIKGKARELLEAPNMAHVGTLGTKGRMLINPVWVHVEDDLVVLNSSEGRTWPANLRANPQVTICVTDRENPYEYVTVWGRVVEDTHEGAKEHIDFLAKKYLDADEYPYLQPGEQRIIFRVEPERVHHYGG